VNPKIIKDPVHGYVEIDAAILPLLDSPAIQRLRYVRQLGFLLPGLSRCQPFPVRAFGRYNAPCRCRVPAVRARREDRLLILVSALLHDVGHGPFSHASEPLDGVMARALPTTILQGLSTRIFPSMLEQIGLDPADVCAVVKGSHPLSGIIHGDLDVDRMDYLLRDAYYYRCPVRYGRCLIA